MPHTCSYSFIYLFSYKKSLFWEGGITVACFCSEMLLFWQGTKLSPASPDIKLRKTRDLAFYETVEEGIWFTQPGWELRKTRDVVFNDALLKYKNPLFSRTTAISEMLQFIWLNLNSDKDSLMGLMVGVRNAWFTL